MSCSVLSDDTTPRSPPPRFERFTESKEIAFFVGLHNSFSDDFDRWKASLKEKGKGLDDLKREDRYLDLPELHEKNILMGKRPDDKGFWTGGFNFPGQPELHRLITGEDEIVYGLVCGWIDDFSCRSYAVLLMGSDRKLYYYDADGDVQDDDDKEHGDFQYYAAGPTMFGNLELRMF